MNGGRGAAQHQDHLVYLAKTEDGRVLRSSTILFRGEESVRIVGKPVSFMSREDKVRVIGFLNGSGAFLVTKAGQKACMVDPFRARVYPPLWRRYPRCRYHCDITMSSSQYLK